jgi:hypothetical protein
MDQSRKGHPPSRDDLAGDDYERLAAKLADLGVKDMAVNIRNKVARRGFLFNACAP